VGTPAFLQEEFGLTAEKIIEQIDGWSKKKK
jgi:transketolase